MNSDVLVQRARDAISYSQNFATAKPNIGTTEQEHILGLCELVADLADRIATQGSALESTPAQEKLSGLVAQWRHNAQGCTRREAHAAGTWRSCARELEYALSARTAPAEGDAVRGHCDYCGKTYGRVACCQSRYEYLKHYGNDILPPATSAPVVGDGSLHDLVDDLMAESRAEWDKSQDYQWSEWVRDRHHGKSSGLATAASRLSAILDTARASKRDGNALDADRYRWLRDIGIKRDWCVSRDAVGGGVLQQDSGSLDSAIDTARTVSRGESNG